MREVNTEIFDGLDIKALRVLAALLESASVSRAAEGVGMSQPAASRALARLRRATGDPLLVRTRKGYVLTARAQAVRPLVKTALERIALVFTGDEFDPASSKRIFRVATTDYGAIAAVTPLMTRLAAAAPGAVLDVTGWTDDTLERLESGRCDLALFADGPLPPDFHYRELFTEHYVLVLRRGHPALAGEAVRAGAAKSVLPKLGEYPQAAMMIPEGRRLAADDVLARMGVATRATTYRTPYFISTPWIIAETDLVLCVPSRVGARMASIAGLAVFDLGARGESFGYRMIWHERAHRDRAQIWLRALMLQACRHSKKDG